MTKRHIMIYKDVIGVIRSRNQEGKTLQ